MQYCDNCAREKNWAITFSKGFVRCEICGRHADCSLNPNNHPSQASDTNDCDNMIATDLLDSNVEIINSIADSAVDIDEDLK